MSDNKLFSLIIPVYNVALYLHECLDSILKQEYVDYEVCIVDDGSTDGSEDICDKYKSRFENVGVTFKLLHQQNQGVSVARNNALGMATGDYIWFVDADDYILPGALKYLHTIVEQSGCDTIFFGDNTFGDNAAVRYEVDERECFLTNHICYCNPLMLFRRCIIEENSLRFTTGMKMAEDLEFQYKYLLYCDKPVLIPYNLYVIRVRENSASRSENAVLSNWYGCCMLLDNMVDFMQRQSGLNQGWMESRISERLKSLLQSASFIPSLGQKVVQAQFNNFIRRYKELGYSNICSGSLKLAFFDVRIYFWLYKLLSKIKKG